MHERVAQLGAVLGTLEDRLGVDRVVVGTPRGFDAFGQDALVGRIGPVRPGQVDETVVQDPAQPCGRRRIAAEVLSPFEGPDDGVLDEVLPRRRGRG